MPDWRPSPGSSDELVRHLGTLQHAVAALGEPASTRADALEKLIDELRWTKLHIDMQLAFQPHVADLRDAEWQSRTFETPELASELFHELSEGLATTARGPLNHVVLRNLRARVEGAMAVAQGWRELLLH